MAFVEVVHWFEVQASRVLAHPDRRSRWYGLDCGAAPERELNVAGEAAAAEAPAVADAIPRHSSLHGALQVRQRLGRQGIDALRRRQSADVGKNQLVPFLGLTGRALTVMAVGSVQATTCAAVRLTGLRTIDFALATGLAIGLPAALPLAC